MPATVQRYQARNFFTQVGALGATKTADGLIDPKLVLSWLLTQLGAPAFFIGLLVPVRESGALLPQLFTAARLSRLRQRKWAWSVGSLIQGICALAIAIAGFTLHGAAAGTAIVVALGILALARSVCSVTHKDVLGKTVPKSKRGTATGTATSFSALLVIIFGAVLASGSVDRTALVLIGLVVAGGLWILAAGIFATLKEELSASQPKSNTIREALGHLSLLKEDPQLRRFIAARALLISTALAPPFMVALGAGEDAAAKAFGGLGLLVIASAGASLLSSYVWGRLADVSSRKVLVFSAAAASLALVTTLLLDITGLLDAIWALPLVIFALMIAYQGVRIGRSTHLVDMASEQTRAAYTALSNTVIGILLILGSGFSLVAELGGLQLVLILLAIMSTLAIPVAMRLDEVQREAKD